MAEDNLKIADLETELRIIKDDKKQLRADLDEAHELVDRMREHVEDANSLIESWIESFDMELNDEGLWEWKPSTVWDEHGKLIDEHNKLVRKWNKFVPLYNSTVSPRNVGRRLEASPAQAQEVRRLRKGGESLRAISGATSLSLRTVRTILDQGTGKERSRTNELRRETFDKLAAADFRARSKGRDYVEKRINSTLKSGAALVKAAKGLGKDSQT